LKWHTLPLNTPGIPQYPVTSDKITFAAKKHTSGVPREYIVLAGHRKKNRLGFTLRHCLSERDVIWILSLPVLRTLLTCFILLFHIAINHPFTVAQLITVLRSGL